MRYAQRGNHTDCIERLLIGTCFSHYASRKIVLKGASQITPALTTFSEQWQGDRKFLRLGEVQDLRQGTSEATYCETVADTYDGIEEVENG